MARGQQDSTTIAKHLTEDNRTEDARADGIGAKLNMLLNFVAAKYPPNQAQPVHREQKITLNFFMVI